MSLQGKEALGGAPADCFSRNQSASRHRALKHLLTRPLVETSSLPPTIESIGITASGERFSVVERAAVQLGNLRRTT